MEVGRCRRAANLKSQQSHLVVNSLLNGQPVQRVQQWRGVAPGGRSEQHCSAHAATSGWCRLEHRGAQHCSNQSWTGLLRLSLISPYVPARTLRSSNTYLLSIPTAVTSHFSSRSFSVSAPST